MNQDIQCPDYLTILLKDNGKYFTKPINETALKELKNNETIILKPKFIH